MSSPLDTYITENEKEDLVKILWRETKGISEERDLTRHDLGRALEIETLDSNEEILRAWLKTPHTLDELYKALEGIKKKEVAKMVKNLMEGKKKMDAISEGNLMQFPLTFLPCFWLQKNHDIYHL